MKCPHCEDEFMAPDCVFLNVEHYGGSAVIRSRCCGRSVRVRRVLKFELSPEYKLEDDWGNACKT